VKNHFIAFFWLAATAAFGCDCIGPSVSKELDRSDLVFQGAVKSVKLLPTRPDMNSARTASAGSTCCRGARKC